MKESYLDHFVTKWIEPKNILTLKGALKKKLPEEFPLMQNNCDLTSLKPMKFMKISPKAFARALRMKMIKAKTKQKPNK